MADAELNNRAAVDPTFRQPDLLEPASLVTPPRAQVRDPENYHLDSPRVRDELRSPQFHMNNRESVAREEFDDKFMENYQRNNDMFTDAEINSYIQCYTSSWLTSTWR